MDIQLRFKNINSVGDKRPACDVEVNGETIYSGDVLPHMDLNATAEANNVLRIHFTNKTGRETVMDAGGNVTQDLNFELEGVSIDGTDLEHHIWQSKYVATDDVYDSCLFFGPKGYWQIDFESPVLRWFLKKDQEKNNDDPHWERDYNYYEEACQTLHKITTR